jgi:hypothetical protein
MESGGGRSTVADDGFPFGGSGELANRLLRTVRSSLSRRFRAEGKSVARFDRRHTESRDDAQTSVHP